MDGLNKKQKDEVLYLIKKEQGIAPLPFVVALLAMAFMAALAGIWFVL